MKMNRSAAALIVMACTVLPCGAAAAKKPKAPELSPLDKYAAEAAQQAEGQKPTGGSLWTPSAQFADRGRDLKASQVNDLVTIVVAESASAVSSGATKTKRQSSATNS